MKKILDVSILILLSILLSMIMCDMYQSICVYHGPSAKQQTRCLFYDQDRNICYKLRINKMKCY